MLGLCNAFALQFAANKMRAKAIYKDKRMCMRGTIESITVPKRSGESRVYGRLVVVSIPDTDARFRLVNVTKEMPGAEESARRRQNARDRRDRGHIAPRMPDNKPTLTHRQIDEEQRRLYEIAMKLAAEIEAWEEEREQQNAEWSKWTLSISVGDTVEANCTFVGVSPVDSRDQSTPGTMRFKNCKRTELDR